jgi:trigger factor
VSASTCKRELLIEVPAQEVAQAAEAVARDFQKHARLPGFRPGKAPLSLIRQRFAGEIQEHVLQHLIPDHFRNRVEAEKLEPVARPEIADVHLHDNEPLRFKAVFEVWPEFELKDYQGLEVEYEAPEVSDSEIEKAIARLQEQQATFTPVEGRALADGDFAEISFEGRPVGGKGNPVKVQDVLAEIGGKETMPEITEKLRGQSAGAELSFPVSYPADYADARLAGKTLQYQVKVHAIKQKQLPELNDDFAKDLGQFETLEQLRGDLRNRLLAQKQRRTDREAKDRLLDALVAGYDFPVPEALVEKQLDSRLERTVRALAAQGVDPRQLENNWAEWREKQRDAAHRDVRAGILLERIAEREGMQAEDADVDQEIKELAQGSGQPPETIRARLTQPESLVKLKTRIRSEKAHELLYRTAKRVPPKAAG